MTDLQIIAAVLGLSAISGYVNYRLFKLPASIGQMAFALMLSLCVLLLGKFGIIDLTALTGLLRQIDFTDLLLHGMLAFLLFAGALHVNLKALKSVALPVSVLATVGVVIATFITGTLVFYGARFLGLDMPYLYALVFGALISPTDPIAALAILKQADVPKNLYMKIGGESLFNDGVAVVVFITILGLAVSAQLPAPLELSQMLFWEVAGGATLGLACGFATYHLLKPIDDYKVEVLITLALAASCYALAEFIHVSAPICVVIAGLVVGNHGRAHSMSDVTRGRLDDFWELLDEMLNTVLFVLIGLWILVIPVTGAHVALGACAVVAVLVGRFISVALPLTAMKPWRPSENGTIRILTWGGLRGGLSIAMALSLPEGAQKEMIVPITYIVVLFSILVQGLTFGRVVRALRQG